MFKPKIGISSFLLLAICLILLFVAIYERNRANEIEANSVTVSNREYRDLVSRDLRLMKRERELQKIARGLKGRLTWLIWIWLGERNWRT